MRDIVVPAVDIEVCEAFTSYAAGLTTRRGMKTPSTTFAKTRMIDFLVTDTARRRALVDSSLHIIFSAISRITMFIIKHNQGKDVQLRRHPFPGLQHQASQPFRCSERPAPIKPIQSKYSHAQQHAPVQVMSRIISWARMPLQATITFPCSAPSLMMLLKFGWLKTCYSC